MDIYAKKLNFVREFLKVSDEELIDKLEKFLRAERRKKNPKKLKPLTIEELNEIVDKSEEDFKKGRAKEAKDLLTKTDRWK
jgi:hypothetical protein